MKKQTKPQPFASRLDDKSFKFSPKNHQNLICSLPIQSKKQQHMFSFPNKQNFPSMSKKPGENLISSLGSITTRSYKSPSFQNSLLKTTSPKHLQHFTTHSTNINKAKPKEQSTNTLIFSGVSKDGKYRVESHSINGQDLAKAVQEERKNNEAEIIQAKKDKHKSKMPFFAPARTSYKQNGVIKSYAVNTHQGITRNYNQDRVSISLNITKNGVRSHFFAIFDGHGGTLCCDFLKECIHEYIVSNANFPLNPRKALYQAIKQAETAFLTLAKSTQNKPNTTDNSGSCLLACLFLDNECYIANVGDSRAIISADGSSFNLTSDHRPTHPSELQRIISSGGKIYRTEMLPVDQKLSRIVGPLRIFPGKLSVSRTIGDLPIKQQQFGGIRGMISSQPEIFNFRLTGREEFLVMCCDGILQRMEFTQIMQIARRELQTDGSMHERAGRAVDSLIREAMLHKSSDNLTVILICLGQLKTSPISCSNLTKIQVQQQPMS